MTKKSPHGPEKVGRVAVRWDKALRGRVISAGPEQTEILLDGIRSRQHTRIFINEELVRLVRRRK